MSNLQRSKTVIRTKDFDASLKFYTTILQLVVSEEYDDKNGSKGVILRIGDTDSNTFIEISEIKKQHSYYQKSFDEDFKNNKASIQISTNDISYWENHFKGKWNSRGPVLRPWGSKYLYLRDPDDLQIIIYQEKN